jgi:hypothetical protein
MEKALLLTKRYNKDGSISLIHAGRVVIKREGLYAREQIESFAKGWFGEKTPNWGKTQFAARRDRS